MSDPVLLGFFTLVSTVALAWMQMRTKRAVVESKREMVSKHEERGKKLQEIETKTDNVCRIVNGEKLALLEALMLLSRRAAELTGKPEDRIEASFYQRRYEEHQKSHREYKESLEKRNRNR